MRLIGESICFKVRRNIVLGQGLMSVRHVSFVLFNIIAVLIYYASLRDILVVSIDNELYSHLVLIPMISGFLIYSRRKVIFPDIRYSFARGTVLTSIGIALYLVSRTKGIELNQNDYFSITVFSAVMFWIGGFTLFYGIQAFRSARFPLMFLILMVPIPSLLLNQIIIFLKWGSAEVVGGIFPLLGIPFAREGYIFHLPGLSIEVAEQCSGIRSSMALFITSILAGHFFLKTGWKKGILSISVIPITVFKNGLRIVILSLLGAFVDKRFLSGILHTNGGILFFLVAMGLLCVVLVVLKKSERRPATHKV